MIKRALHRKSGMVPAIVTVLLGWVLLLPQDPPGLMARWSYDLLQFVLPGHAYQDLVIIHMDELAMRDYGTNILETAGRPIHTRLLDRLTSQDHAKVVVLDVMLLSQDCDLAIDEKLAQALHRNRKVVLAADRVRIPGLPKSETEIPPRAQFQTNAAGWGISKVWEDTDGVVRRYGILRLVDIDPGAEKGPPDLAWAAAEVTGAFEAQHRQRLPADQRRWLNYYRSAVLLESRSMSYTNAETQEPGFFDGKAVFIGGKPDTGPLGQVTDVFRSPFGGRIPGVYLTALAYANLVHGECLTRPGIFTELGVLLLVGAVVALGLQCIQLRTAFRFSLAIAVLVPAVALVLVLVSRVWFPWAIIALAQVPCALAFRLFSARRGLLAESALREAQFGAPSTSSGRAPEVDAGREIPTPSEAPTRVKESGQPDIPDHTLIRCIGEGSYGQVWVARNAIGLYHAVKVVYQNRFGTEQPYERALRGIQKFMPVSRSHDGFVHILHVGRNEPAGYFFYIMEAGDDQDSGQQIDPATYTPKSLASELRRWERLSGEQCLTFMIAIAEAVERLHQHQLIHRDIKPANIIFVNGRPKLADIDLVTALSAQGETSCIGTEGYMAPEGPGTAGADVFSLGRVLYVALTGKAPNQCPELPTRVSSQPDCDLVLELNRISCQACEMNPSRRYSSAALMRADLLEIAGRLEQRRAENEKRR